MPRSSTHPKRNTQAAVFCTAAWTICLKTPFYLANRLWMRRQTSSTFSRELNAEMRKNPSPLEPKPEPGVITTFASCSILSNICQLSRQIAAQVTEAAFPYLDAAPVRLGTAPCPLPFNLGLENAATPQVADIIKAAKAVLYQA